LTFLKLSPNIDFKKYKIFKEIHKFFITELSKLFKYQDNKLLDLDYRNGKFYIKLFKGDPK